MATIAELGIKVDTSQVKAAATNLDTLSTTAKKTQAAANDTTDKLGQLGRKAGMAGVQIQQFVGQVQGGQNVMGALSAQATDLGFVLGAPLIGAVVGLSAAFAGPFISALFSSSQSSEELSEKILELTDDLKTATYAQRQFIAAQNAEKIREQKEAIQDAKEKLAEYTKEMDVLLKRTGGFGLRATELNRLMDEQQAIIDTAKMAIADYSEQTDKAAIAEKDRLTAIQKLTEKLQEEAATTGATAAQVTAYHLEKMKATEAERAQVMALQDTIDKKKALIESEKEAIKYANAFALAQSASIANAQKNAQVSFDALAASQRDQLQVINDRYLQEQAIIANALGADVITVEQANAAKLASDKAYSEQRRAMEVANMQATLGAAGTLAGNLAAIAEQGGKESFTAYKRFAQAAAGINAAATILNVLASPIMAMNPILGGALAASYGALAAVQVAQIERQEYSPARALGGQVQPGETYTVGENGPEQLTMGSMGGHITSNANSQGKGDTYVMQLSAGVTGTVRAEMAAMMPMIMKTVSQTVRSARR